MNQRKATIAGAIGNTLEWYDFAVYGYVVPIIATQFFPSEDKTVSLIAAFGAFAAGYMMRPIGAIIIGHIADRVGRRLALMISVLLMAIPTTCIAFLPTYAQIGIAAPILLTFIRLLQGLAVGGEYTSSLVYLVENAPPGYRARRGCWAVMGATGGILLGSAVSDLFHQILSEQQIEAWGWRIPFLFGLFLAVIGIFLRRHMEALPPSETELQRAEFPIANAVKNYGASMAKVIGLCILFGISFYIGFVYITTYLVEYDAISETTALNISTISLLVLLIAAFVFASLADRYGRKPILWFGVIGLLVFSYPLFWLITQESVALALIGELGFVIFVGAYSGSIPPLMVELFPRPVRVTAVSVAYNVPIAFAGGTAPVVATSMISLTGDIYAPAYYLIAAAVIAVLCLLTVRETLHDTFD